MTARQIIEKWRLEHNKTQDEMAKLLGLNSQQNYNDLKTGRTKKISVDIAEKFKKISDINVLDVTRVSRENNVNASGGSLDDQNSMIMEGQSKTYLEKRREKKGISEPYMAPLVPVKAQAGYARAYSNTDFVNSLEMYPILPGVDPRGAVWRFFEVQGDSMEPTLFERDYILVSMVPPEDWIDIKPRQIYVIVTGDEVLVKIVFPQNDDTWILASSNKRIKQRKIDVADIKEVWRFRGRTTRDVEIPKIEIKT